MQSFLAFPVFEIIIKGLVVHISQHIYSKIKSAVPDYTNINYYPTAFPYGNGTVLHFYQQQESSTTKTAHKVINKRLKTYV